MTQIFKQRRRIRHLHILARNQFPRQFGQLLKLNPIFLRKSCRDWKTISQPPWQQTCKQPTRSLSRKPNLLAKLIGWHFEDLSNNCKGTDMLGRPNISINSTSQRMEPGYRLLDGRSLYAVDGDNQAIPLAAPIAGIVNRTGTTGATETHCPPSRRYWLLCRI